ncbi:hypothetical protein [Cellulomonas sp. NS3]|uniref:hypothetical protein n=1 Tax=Cellulomonas sp. NS3 TaxID=2973977 RepID=UPI0021632339|nr:hypothetical protein [Cellulomonas sp. NS3]
MRRPLILALVVCATTALTALAPSAVAGPLPVGPPRTPVPTAAVDLGTLVPGTETVATAVNARGEVVGVSGSRAFLWSDGVLTDVSALTGLTYLTLTDINRRGQVVGSYVSDEDGTEHAVLIDGATVTELGEGTALHVNDHGVVAGLLGGALGGAPFRWERGVRTDLTEVPGRAVSLSRVVDLNERGTVLAQVVGPESDFEDLGHRQGYVWTRDGVTLLADPALRYVVPSDLDDRGRVTGFTGVPDAPGSTSAFVWWRGELTLLRDPVQGCFENGVGLDDHGRVLVGTTCPANGVGLTEHALWDDGDVTPVEPPAGATLRSPVVLGAQGLVAGVLSRPDAAPRVGAWRDGRWSETAVPTAEQLRVVDVSPRGHVLIQTEGRALLWTVRPRS